MNKWFVKIGVTLIVVALISVSPIMDLLPVDWWYTLSRLFSREGEVVYMKVVPSTPDYTATIILGAIGLCLVIFGKIFENKRKANN